MPMPIRTPVETLYSSHEIPGTTVAMQRLNGAPHPLVPALDPDYLFRQALVEEIAWAVEARQNVMLVGDAGPGKSSLIEQLAAQLNRPLRRQNMHGESDASLLVGRDVPTEVDGQRRMVYAKGILATAMERGYWLLLDEIDSALQPVLFVLQSVLEDDGKLVLEDADGTVVHKHPEFRFFATANTIGIASKNKLLYSGTMSRMNEATLDRFGCVIHVTEMDEAQAVDVIKRKVPDLDPVFAQAIMRIAKEVRAQLSNEALTCTFSMRRCLQWARAMRKFHPLRAAKLTVLNKLNGDDAKVLEGILQRYFGGKK